MLKYVIRARTNRGLRLGFGEVVDALAFAVFPLNATARGRAHCLTRCVNIIGPRAQGAAVICQSGNSSHEHTLYCAIALLVVERPEVLRVVRRNTCLQATVVIQSIQHLPLRMRIIFLMQVKL